VATYLDRIVAAHREAAAEDTRPLAPLVAAAEAMQPVRGFTATLRRASAPTTEDGLGGRELAVIAEVKRRSPSKGPLDPDLDPADLALAYAKGGAACLSVLTDVEFFGGSPDDLRVARDAVGVPVLRKDFTVSAHDVCDARLMGADAVLLIAAALDDSELEEFHSLAGQVGIDALVEVHDEAELERALAIDSDVLGINNRDLDDLTVDLETTAELITDVPAGKTVVSESGYDRPEQLVELERIGVDAVLIGEALMRAGDPEVAVRELTMDEEAAREHYLDRAANDS
jgi:indole-3-glycerol phosphate synthase